LNTLVTGADGFVASHLCEYLLERGCDVTGLVKRNSGNILKNIKHLEGKMDIVWGDMCDSSQMLKITKGIDVVFHLAAQSHVAYSLVNPVEQKFMVRRSTSPW
jgi:nucleoside-diphosphate-sugar epimerase